MPLYRLFLTALAIAAANGVATAAAEPESAAAADQGQVWVIGDPTLYPIAQEVAKHSSVRPDGRDFRIDSTATSDAIERFCAGNGLQSPDILNISRRMCTRHVDLCRSHGVESVVEVKVGYDGITLAESADAPPMSLSTIDLYLALAARVPDPKGGSRLVPNPYRSWKEVDPTLPQRPIKVLGPSLSSGTLDAFAELAMEAGCGLFDAVRQEAGRDRKKLAEICRTMRADGAYEEASEDGLAAVLTAEPTRIGIVAYHVIETSGERLKAVTVDGELPSRETITTGQYPLTHPLYVYYKKDNLEARPAIGRYMDELTSEGAWGENGYLQHVGLVPMMPDERRKFAYIVDNHVDPGCPPFCR